MGLNCKILYWTKLINFICSYDISETTEILNLKQVTVGYSHICGIKFFDPENGRVKLGNYR